MDVDKADVLLKMQLSQPRLEQSKCKSYSGYERSTAIQLVGGNHSKKAFHPRTPSKHCNSTAIGAAVAASSTFTSATGSSSSSSIHISYAAVINTPPAKRFQRVRNPFEPMMTERLHLPLIASPSLFQRPTTPQLSSTQFEWTIDEVSSLKPAHVEPHETQFHDSPDPDPEYEAKAQSAISSYFKEQQIVPSPVDCPLRSQRIILSELNANTPITKPGRRIRDCGTQTELTLPWVLPPALEEALRPYLQPHLALAVDIATESRAVCGDEELGCSSDSNGAYFSATDAKDISLRRKLFDMHNIVVLDSEGGSTPTAPGKHRSKRSPSSVGGSTRSHIAIVGKLSDSMDKSSFGSLSPISASDGLSISPHSPHGSASKLKSQLRTFLQDLAEAEQLSPIHPPVYSSSKRRTCNNVTKSQSSKDSYRSAQLNRSEATTIGDFSMSGGDDGDGGDKFTPDRSSSPLHLQLELADSGAALAHQSIDSSFNMKISRLAVNSSKCNRQRTRRSDTDLFAHDDTDEILDDDDDMQVSQLSAQSLNCSSSNSSDTPRSKRRSASRKNLSQSFSLNWLEDGSDETDLASDEPARSRDGYLDVPRINISNVDEILAMQQANACAAEAAQRKCGSNVKPNGDETARAVFYRTDSGFNEMPGSGSNSAYSINSGHHQGVDGFEDVPGSYARAQLSPTTQLPDVSMVCCSTPSRCAAATS